MSAIYKRDQYKKSSVNLRLQKGKFGKQSMETADGMNNHSLLTNHNRREPYI